jgi:hypothetical protein
MTKPYVSIYEDAFLEAFGRGMEELPQNSADLVKGIVDKIHEAVLTPIMDYVVNKMATEAADALREEAAKVAQSMLMDALAGDDFAIQRLFGFDGSQRRHAYLGALPTQWALIDAIAERRPDVFLDERLKQRDREIADLKERGKILARSVLSLQKQLSAGEDRGMTFYAIDGWIYQDDTRQEPRYAVCRISDENGMTADQICALLNRGEAAIKAHGGIASPQHEGDKP